MSNQSQNPNEPKSQKGGQQQPQQAQDDAHTNSSRAGERPDPSQGRSDPNRKAGTQHGSNTPQGGEQQGMEPDRAQPGSQHGSQGNQGHQGGQSGQKSNDPSRGGK
jgi:hypothetical protein